MSQWDISYVSKQAGVPASTLRYYEQRGLIQAIGRNGLKRVFGPQIFNQLALITLAQRVGFSLDEINIFVSGVGKPNLDRDLLVKKIDELDAGIAHMTLMREQLHHMAACPAEDHFDCPSFRKLLVQDGDDAKPPVGRKAF